MNTNKQHSAPGGWTYWYCRSRRKWLACNEASPDIVYSTLHKGEMLWHLDHYSVQHLADMLIWKREKLTPAA